MERLQKIIWFACAGVTSLIAFLALWELAVRWFNVREFVLPAPSAVFADLIADWRRLMPHTLYTGTEIVLGFLLGVFIAAGFAVATSEFRMLRAITEPLIVMSQAVPKVALAPLFIIWLGFGASSKVVMAALISFYPVYINALTAFQSCNPELLLFADLVGQGRLSRLVRLKIPASLPHIFAGLRTSCLLSVVGVVVSEFVGADKGLGYVILESTGRFDNAGAFAAIFVIFAIGALFYSLVVLLEVLTLSGFHIEPAK